MTSIGIIMLVSLAFMLAIGVAVMADEWTSAAPGAGSSSRSSTAGDASASSIRGVVVDRRGHTRGVF